MCVCVCISFADVCILLHLLQQCRLMLMWPVGVLSFEAPATQLLPARRHWSFITRAPVKSFLPHAQVWPLVGANIPAATLLQRVQAIRPSLGASGAVIALFAMVAARQPERQVGMFMLVEKQKRGNFLSASGAVIALVAVVAARQTERQARRLQQECLRSLF